MTYFDAQTEIQRENAEHEKEMRRNITLGEVYKAINTALDRFYEMEECNFTAEEVDTAIRKELKKL